MKSNIDDFPYEIEQLKVSKNKLSIRVNAISGKDGKFWVCISPSLNISGYGKTVEEAKSSFDENLMIFIDDFGNLSLRDRINLLTDLGWKQNTYFKKQLSKAFVDEDGILQNLEQPRLVSLETIA